MGKYCTLSAQNPVPAALNNKKIWLQGGTVHIGNGEVINESAIFIEGDKISWCGPLTAKPNFIADTVINTSGKQIYPGLIAVNSVIGLNEIEAVRATNDMYETGDFNPSVRSLVAYNTDSKIIPTVRTNGILLAQIVPQGGIVSGTSSIMKMDGWNWEDAVFKADEGIHIRFPSQIVLTDQPSKTEELKERANKNLKELIKFLTDAKAYYLSSDNEEINIHFEAMKGVFSGSKKLYVHANYSKDIRMAIHIMQTLKLNWILCEGADSWMLADELKNAGVPVVLKSLHTLPFREDEDIDIAFKTPYLLSKAGVNFCISTEGFWQFRNLPFIAGNAVSYGLNKEQALGAITLQAAKILGIDNRTGSIEKGKSANIVVSDGDILDMKTSYVSMALIEGSIISLDNIQIQLYNKYKKKYGQ